MKKLMVPVVCALVGCAAGVAMPAITAQTFATPASVHPVQSFCEVHNGTTQFNEAVRHRGAEGFRVTGIDAARVCFERPAQ